MRTDDGDKLAVTGCLTTIIALAIIATVSLGLIALVAHIIINYIWGV